MTAQQTMPGVRSIAPQNPEQSQTKENYRLSRIGGEQLGFKSVREEKIAHALGWFSLGLGIAQLLAPRKMGRLIGVGEHPGLLRLVGLREIASGVGILARPQPAPWLWSRVGGDLMDLTLLGLAMKSEGAQRSKIAGAGAAVLGIAALDLICSERVGGHPLARLETPRRKGVVRVTKRITINRSPEECYRFWRNFENLPRFMAHLKSVQIASETRSHWAAHAPAGGTVRWDAEITEDRPNELIAWRSLEGADVENSGVVRFERAPGGRGALLSVEMQYKPPGGEMSTLVAKLFGEDPTQQVQEDLRRFKQVMETGEVPTTDGQSAGHRSPGVRLLSRMKLR